MRSVVRWCERLMEACWLLAVGTVPLYFNPLSNNSFEPEKAVLLRVLSLVAVFAWGVVNLARAGGSANQTRQGNRLAIAAGSKLGAVSLVLVGVFALVQVVSTALSIAPGISLAGSYVRLQGSATVFSYLALFLVVLTSVHSRDRRERLISMCLLASFPVAAYGVAQRLGLDPLLGLSTGDESVVVWPVRSTFGNHIFAAAYLCMTVPLALARFATRLQQARQLAHRPVKERSDEQQTSTIARNASIVTGLQLLLAVFLVASATWTQLWWGVMAILSVFVVLGLSTRSTRPTQASLYLSVVAYGILAVVQLLAIIFSQARGPWLGVATAVFLLFFLLALRQNNRALSAAAIGGLALVAVFVVVLNLPSSPLSALKREPVFDRLSHLVDPTEGANSFRLVIWRHAVELFASHPQIGPDVDQVSWLRPLVGYGPETLSLALPRITQQDLANAGGNFFDYDRAHNFLLDELTTTGAVGLLVYLSVVGLAVATGLRALWGTETRERQWLLSALLAAVGGHLVEAFFGIGVVGTLMLLWVFLALLAGSLRSEAIVGSQFGATDATTARLAGRRAVEASAKGGRRKPWKPDTTRAVSKRSMAREHGVSSHGLRVGGYVALTLVFWLVAAIAPPAGWPLGASVFFLVWALLGVALVVPASGTAASVIRPGVSPSLLLAVGALVIVVLGIADLKVSSADIQFKIGTNLSARAQAQALRWFQSAAGEYPRSVYFAAIGRVFMQAGRSAPAGGADAAPSLQQVLAWTPTQGAQMNKGMAFSYAQVALEQARRQNPLDADGYANLARLSHLRGELGESEQLDAALDYYARAVALSPRALRLYSEWARVYLSKSDYSAARDKVQEAIALDPNYWMTHSTLASVLEVQGDTGGALDEAKTALRLGSIAWPRLPESQLAQLSEAVTSLERQSAGSRS